MSEEYQKITIKEYLEYQTLKQELQKTREQLEKAEKVIGFYANWANYKEQVIAREDCDVVPFYFRNDELIGGKRARQYFKDKQGE